ncbi:MAG: amidohydrolase family protein [Acidobacteriota bacterium]|nr:amidohydrolase family protein [Acidobacteriota bacterium]
MTRQYIVILSWALVLLAASVSVVLAQQEGEMIFHNGQLITVDDHGFNSELGTTAQAMYVKDGKIVKIGENDDILSLAGPNVQVNDLKGRTVLPGFILTHEHPWDWNAVEPPVVSRILTDDVVVTRFMEGSPQENKEAFPGVLAEAVEKAQPGQWIYIVFTLGRNYEYGTRGNGPYGRGGMSPEAFNILDGTHITKEQLDMAAPDNPVLLRDVFIWMMVNQKAYEASREVFPQDDVNRINPETGMGGAGAMRWFFGDVVMEDHYSELIETMRLGLEWWAGYGMTSFSSNAYNPTNIRVYTDLDRQGRLPIREAWSWNWRTKHFYSDPYFLDVLRAFTGQGSDYLWFIGGRIIEGGSCTVARVLETSRLAQIEGLGIEEASRNCAYGPGSDYAELLYNYIKKGNRYVNHHTVGDRDIDNIMDVIYRASKDAGMTDEDIRGKRHAFDHSQMFPRADQVEFFQQLGIYASGNVFEIFQGSPAIFDIYGETAATWVVPKNRLSEANLYNTLEMDRALGSTNFTIFSGLDMMINRKSWDDKVYAPDQRVDRETALKISTIWGAYYMFKEDLLGSLESGKWADFIVVDRDYLTIPEDEIGDVKVLMTVVGGKPIHLVPSLANEFGMEATGAQVTHGGDAVNW